VYLPFIASFEAILMRNVGVTVALYNYRGCVSFNLII
jgi:hypothetical protein